MNQKIDINCDLGEGVGNEAKVLPLISSCNIACGGHAGDQATMRWVVSLAKKHQVNVGAHPSYPDKANFGRTSLDMSPKELIETVRAQIEQLVFICKEQGVQLHHIKAHGALYNDLAKGGDLSQVFLEAIAPYKADTFLYVPATSEFAKRAVDEGFAIKREAFGDRNYNTDGSLVSRKEANALITEPKLILEHMLRMITETKVRTVANTIEAIQADTYCIHGDTPDALQILTYLTNKFSILKIIY